MLDGLQRLTGAPVPRRKRIGVRPEHMQRAISARYGIDARSARDSNWAALFETALVTLARAGELASNLRAGSCTSLQPLRTIRLSIPLVRRRVLGIDVALRHASAACRRCINPRVAAVYACSTSVES